MAAPTRGMYIAVTAGILLFIPLGVVINYWGPDIRDAWRFRKIGRPIERKGKVVGYLWAGGNSHPCYHLDPTGKVVRQWPTAYTCYQAQLLGNGNLLIPKTGEGLVEIPADGEPVWTAETAAERDIYDLARLANGNTLCAAGYARRAVEIDRDGREVWSHAASNALYSVQRLANGNTLLAGEGEMDVFELTLAGTVAWSWKNEDPGVVIHVRRLANGNTLLTFWSGKKIVELDRAGREVWSHKCRGMPMSAERLLDRSTLVAQQSPNELLLVSPDGTEKVIAKDLADGKAQPIYSGR